MIFETNQIAEFKKRLQDLTREELLQIIAQQNPEYIKDINRIEWVFRNKLGHLTDTQGQPIKERDLTQKELINLIDPPFIFSPEMMKQGFNEDAQKQIHIASDPVLWCKQILGAQPRSYQTLVMREMNDQVVLRWGRRLGKALDIETDIPTVDGYKKMADVQVGDQVFDESGFPCNVTDVTEFQYDRKCYLVKFVDGSEIVADADHIWSVHDATDRNAIGLGQPRPLQNLTTEQMSKSVLHYGANTKERNYSIPLAGKVQFPEKELPIHPWVYGFITANGYENDNCVRVIAKDHEYIMKKFKELDYELEKVIGNKFRIKEISKEDFNFQYIENNYLTSSIKQREELLRGLCDARASLANDYIEISLPNEEFVNQIFTIVTSLGYECRKTQKINKKNGKYYGTNYKILWFNNPDCFSLDRKQQKTDDRRRKTPIRLISSIEEIDSRPVKCLAVDSRSRLYLASKSHIPTHNSFFLSMYIIWYAFVHERARVLVMAPTKAQGILLYEQVLELAEESSIVNNSITKKPRSPHLEIWLRNKSSMKFFTTGMRSGQRSDGARGQEADMIVLDEMDYMGPEDLVALMAMLQDTDENKAFGKKLIGASTPTGQRSTYWRWNTDPKEKFSSFYFPSYVNPLWSQETEDDAHRHYRNEQHYRHEIEADWGEDADGVYPRKYVDIAFDNNLNPYDQFRPNPDNFIYTLGVDWDKHGAGVNIAVAQCELNNSASRPIDIVYREEIQKGDFTYIEAVDYIIKLNTQYNFEHIYIDQGAGEVQAEMLHKYGLEHPYTKLHQKVKACHFSNIVEVRDPYTRQVNKKRLKPFMVDNLVYQLEQKNVRFQPDDDELFLQLISYIKIRETDSGNPVYAPGGETVDHAHDALILALFAVAENYDDLFSLGLPQSPRPVSGNFFMVGDKEVRKKGIEVEKETSSKSTDKILTARSTSIRPKAGSWKKIKRSSF